MKGMGNIANAIKNREEPNDIFYTPSELVRDLLQQVPLDHGDMVLDPFMGEGAFFDAFFPFVRKDWCEIDKGRDFYEYFEPVDWVISNPPFSQLTKTLQHTMTLARRGFGYLMPTYSLTHSRINNAAGFGYQLRKLIFFPTPKHWQLGFQMCFAIFVKEPTLKPIPCEIITLDLTAGIQHTLPI